MDENSLREIELTNEERKDLTSLTTEFYNLRLIQDPIHREYELIQIAKQFNLPLDSFRQMFKDYCRQQTLVEARFFWWKAPFLYLEQGLESFAQKLSEMDIFKVLEYLGRLSILVGVIVFISEIPQRAEQQVIQRKRLHYEAWQIINSNEGKRASGGRIDALQDLNRDRVVLAGINLENAFLNGIDLSNGILYQANLKGALLGQANLSGADLKGANISSGAFLYGTNLNGADLHLANLEGAYFDETTNFSNAELPSANLSNASFLKSNLANAYLPGANLSGANFLSANLENANLQGVILEKAVYDRDTRFPPGFNPKNQQMILIEPGVDLSGINLSGSNLLTAQLKDSNLSGADLSNSDLDGADLSNANIANANFRQARNLTVRQIKSARNWELAIFDEEFRQQLDLKE